MLHMVMTEPVWGTNRLFQAVQCAQLAGLMITLANHALFMPLLQGASSSSATGPPWPGHPQQMCVLVPAAILGVLVQGAAWQVRKLNHCD
jgi:hypothetical protein